MRRCRSFLRIVFFLLTSWLLLVALWVALPSPSVESQDPNYYSTSVLKAGKTLTRVYKSVARKLRSPQTQVLCLSPICSIADFFPYHDRSTSVQVSRVSGRLSFALDYTIDLSGQSLRLGPDSHLDIKPPTVLPSLSPPFTASATVGDQDGINLPWFTHADATLLFGQSDIYGQRMASLSLRARWTESGSLELWPDSEQWADASSRPSGLSPLLSLKHYTSATQAQFQAILPTDKPSSSPSYSYLVRVMILKIIKPTVLGLRSLLAEVGAVCATLWAFVILLVQFVIAYMLIVTLVWWVKGRPPFREFLATSLLTRFIHAQLVSTRGEEANSDKLNSIDNHEEQPKPLSSIWAFFTSKSPLDDLLFTFAFTRRLTQPLRQTNPTVVSKTSPSVQETVDIDLEAGARSNSENEKN